MYADGAAGITRTMNALVERSHDTWIAAVKLALVVSAVAVVAAVAASVAGIPQAAVVLPVIVVGFVASWLQTARVAAPRRAVEPVHAAYRARRHLVG